MNLSERHRKYIIFCSANLYRFNSSQKKQLLHILSQLTRNVRLSALSVVLFSFFSQKVFWPRSFVSSQKNAWNALRSSRKMLKSSRSCKLYRAKKKKELIQQTKRSFKNADFILEVLIFQEIFPLYVLRISTSHSFVSVAASSNTTVSIRDAFLLICCLLDRYGRRTSHFCLRVHRSLYVSHTDSL